MQKLRGPRAENHTTEIVEELRALNDLTPLEETAQSTPSRDYSHVGQMDSQEDVVSISTSVEVLETQEESDRTL